MIGAVAVAQLGELLAPLAAAKDLVDCSQAGMHSVVVVLVSFGLTSWSTVTCCQVVRLLAAATVA
jgi:hypothetical protein